jgi:dCMP deaminase
MPSQNLIDKTYLKMALVWSDLSKANRKKVGCLIVKNGMIISDGYNGTPKGFDNRCETSIMPESISPDDLSAHPPNALITKPEVLHAESNAITKLAKSTQSSIDASLYTTASPCLDCAKLIIQSGISRVIYSELYKNSEGIDLLEKAGITVDKCSI